MKSAEDVQALVEKYKAERLPIKEAAWNTARACVGWPYVFGAEGRPTTKDGVEVLAFDCQGFTEWCLLQFGVDSRAAGATSQWNKNSNWAAKGMVKDGIPQGQLVCLFYRSKNDSAKMAHTGFGYNGATCECSVGVQYFSSMNKKWEYWAIPKGVDDNYDPEHVVRPTLRKGSKGDAVKQLQQELNQLGYDAGKVDGIFGANTQKAVEAFQRDHPPLKVDGICGPATWAAIDAALEPAPEPEPTETWTVTIPGLTKEQAEELCKEWSGATMKKG